jgi:type II secretory pathway pseudopilin PulG
MLEMKRHRYHLHPRTRAFSLTEMLVVVGILIVVVGLLLPAVMRARQRAKQTQCMNNLRQIGAFYTEYADRNDDDVPLGTSRFSDPTHKGPVPINPPITWPSYYTRLNEYLWVEGAPSSAMGPFFLGRMITPDNAKLLYCPSEQEEEFRWESLKPLFGRALAGEPVSIVTGYAVRPIELLWTHDHVKHTVEYPKLMAKLNEHINHAIVAEHPQLQPYSHGSPKAEVIHALYGDGGVRAVPYKVFETSFYEYVTIVPFTLPGTTFLSNLKAINESDPKARSIWQDLDRYR